MTTTPSKISCLIVDDEEPAHEVLKFLIGKIPWLKFAGSCYNAVDALEIIPDMKPDIIFLDVNMPELSGLDLLSIVQTPHSHIIMTTAYSEYAIDGFTYDVTSFLLKPIGFDRFLKAVTKVRRLTGESQGAISKEKAAMNDSQPAIDLPDVHIINSSEDTKLIVSDNAESNDVKDEYMWIRADRKMFCVWFKDIYFIEGLKD